ncbi:MAG: hypothetical protein FWG70_04440 [Oscillospiraceae bacterium]|nr:hypothetical protein [Oscillospiraceae bacterium]
MDFNPGTGVGLAIIPIVAAAVILIAMKIIGSVTKKRKEQQASLQTDEISEETEESEE